MAIRQGKACRTPFRNVTCERDNNFSFAKAIRTEAGLDDVEVLCVSRSRPWRGQANWICEDPLGFEASDTNLRRYVGNSPSIHTDPTGLVEFMPSVDKPDSMDWGFAILPDDQVGNTRVKLKMEYRVLRNPKSGKYKLKYTVKVDLAIELDKAAILRLGKTPERCYGHEQVHVKNILTITKRLVEKLEAFESEELFDTEEEARAHAKRLLEFFNEKFEALVTLDKLHKGEDPVSPTNGQGYPPIGTMPAAPKK
ncbi:MAG: hypothetical protein RIC55_17875 [Pirellulaceae bacterium]